MPQDFAQLYSELGLRPGCSLAELKRAYRRRVAELHPDRGEPQAAHLAHGLPLPDLIALYTAAAEFHRQYGRLPGGTPPRGATITPLARASMRRTPPHPMPEDEPRLPFARTIVIALLLLALLLALQASWDRLGSDVGESAHTPAGFVPNTSSAGTDSKPAPVVDEEASSPSSLTTGNFEQPATQPPAPDKAEQPAQTHRERVPAESH